VAVDGSDLSIRAARAGLALLPDGTPVVVVTAVDPADPTLVTGTGLAGGVLTPSQYAEVQAASRARAEAIVDEAVKALELDGAVRRLLEGPAGHALCAYADEIGARAVVVGTRGRGGIKRAVLGSVADVVVRRSPCPVIVSGPGTVD
jgi:nucleotide-binding universal stress UspA family protein